jgi:hypothetical protein
MGCGPSRPRRFNGNGVSYIDHPQDIHSTGGMGHGRSHGGMSSTGMGGSAISGRHGMSSGMSGGRHGMSSGISSGMSMGRSSRTSGGMSSGTSMGRSSRSGGGLGGMMSGFGRSRSGRRYWRIRIQGACQRAEGGTWHKQLNVEGISLYSGQFAGVILGSFYVYTIPSDKEKTR